MNEQILSRTTGEEVISYRGQSMSNQPMVWTLSSQKLIIFCTMVVLVKWIKKTKFQIFGAVSF